MSQPEKFNIIYADPPWSYKVWSKDTGSGRSAESHYSTMDIKDIKNLPVSTLAADDCVLFLWVTFPLLQEGLDTMKAWGFKYKTCGFNWVKKNKKANSLFWGLGYWTRANSELCLIGTKGKPKRFSRSVHQVVLENIGRHSEKPQVVRDRIVKLCGDLPRVELFARDISEGWSVWGNEVKSDIVL